MASSAKFYYCYQCNDRVTADEFSMTCARCGGGFIEERTAPSATPANVSSDPAPIFRPEPSSSNASTQAPPNQGPIPNVNRTLPPFHQHPGVYPHYGGPIFQGIPTQGIYANTPYGMPFGLGAMPPGPPIAQAPVFYVPVPAMPQQPRYMPFSPNFQPVQPQVRVVQRVPSVAVPSGILPTGAGAAPHQPGVTQITMGIPLQPGPNGGVQLQANQLRDMLNAHLGQYNDPNGQGVVMVGIQDENGQAMGAPMFQFAGGNLNDLIQSVTENLDDVIAALMNQMGHGGPPSITQEEIDRIPSRPVEQQMIDEHKSCAICLENFRLGENYKDLTCTHQFHQYCIDRWLTIHGNCPICRTHFGGAGNNQNQNNQQQNQAGGQAPVFGQVILDQLFPFQQPQPHQVHQQQAQQQQQQQQQPANRVPFVFRGTTGGTQHQPHHHHHHHHVLLNNRRDATPSAATPRSNTAPASSTNPTNAQQGGTQPAHNRNLNTPAGQFGPNAGPQAPRQPRMHWHGQVIVNDSMGQPIVLEIANPIRQPTAAAAAPGNRQQTQPGQGPASPRVQASATSTASSNGQPQPQDPRRPDGSWLNNIVHGAVSSLTQALTNPAARQASQSGGTVPAPNAGGPQATTGQPNRPQAGQRAGGQQSGSGAAASGGYGSNKRNLQDDPDVD